MRERRDVMRLHLNSGISDLNHIRNNYNSFADGGQTNFSFVPDKYSTVKNANTQQVNSTYVPNQNKHNNNSELFNIEQKSDNTKVVPTILKQGYHPESAKEYFYQNVKPVVDNVLYNTFLYRPDFDAREYKTFDDAYNASRSTGAKTFIWNGKQYNTDYKGNPNKTLVEQKQEELDTYGITNEQTQNKNLFENRLYKNLNPYGYNDPVKRTINAVILNNYDEARNISDKNDELTKERYDLFGLTLGFPQKNNTIEISKYKPSGATDDYYYKLKNDRIIGNNSNEYNSGDDSNIPVSVDEYGNVVGGNKTYGYSSYKLNVGSNGIFYDTNLGEFTVGKGKNYVSYYDKWDINPFGQGNDSAIFNFGKPFSLYDRKYFKNK